MKSDEKDKQIKIYMDKLGLTKQEALEMWNDDHDIDHGKKKDFDLTDEQKKVEKKMRGTGTRKVTVYNFNKRERKKDDIKVNFINSLYNFISSLADVNNAVISNPSRQIDFTIGDEDYYIALTRKRKKGN